MQEKPDAQLLRAHLQGDESAFREIVSRHADLVYSAALRQVNSQVLAQDIAQTVFVDLVRKSKEVGARMANDGSLAGWLYRSTRFAVLNHLRDDRRRAEHERQAMEQLITDTSPAADWERIRPILDEAMAELSDDDRDALLLRYFKNHDFQTVGRALGLSDDAAQKRVSRAVERLREYFSKRDVAIGVSGLVVMISANAVQASPTGLAAAITTSIFGGTVTAAAASTHLALSLITMKITTVIAIGAATAATVAYLVLHTKANRPQPENQAVTAQPDKSSSDQNATPATNDAKDGAIAQTDPNEILRLRGEVGVLRQQTNELGKAQAATRSAQGRQLSEEMKRNAGQMGIAVHLLMDMSANKLALTNINQLKKAPPGALSADINLDNFEIVPQPVPLDWRFPEVAVFRERTPRRTADGKWVRVYGMVDGQAIEQISANGDFDSWEKKHLMPQNVP
jgi:RNA polymerase sigma factor (sigma-70 family)